MPAPRPAATPAAPQQRKVNNITRLTSDIYVKNKKSQNQNKNAMELVKKNLPSETIKNHIENVIAIPMTGSVVVKCTNEESRQLVAEALQTAIGEDYQVEESRPKIIKVAIKIYGVSDDDLTKEPNGAVDRAHILNQIQDKNDLPPDCFLQVLQARKSQNGGPPAHLLLLADETTKNTLEKSGIKIGYTRLEVKDMGPIPICYNCCGLNHSTSRCQSEPTCSICAEVGHLGRDCEKRHDSTAHRCASCVNYNKKGQRDPTIDQLPENHKTGDKLNCESYKRVLKNFYSKHKKD
jgi:hypothetical protein